MINGKDQEIITINKTGNSILNNAKYSADNTDEWYTTYETIAEELSHYKNQFIDKVVLCNCDDPFCLKHHTGHLDVSDYRLHQVDLISKEFPGRLDSVQ